MDYDKIRDIVQKWFSEEDDKYGVDHLREYLQSLAEDESSRRIDEIEGYL